jgi:transposase-like protein/Mor family transcriptional regulator
MEENKMGKVDNADTIRIYITEEDNSKLSQKDIEEKHIYLRSMITKKFKEDNIQKELKIEFVDINTQKLILTDHYYRRLSLYHLAKKYGYSEFIISTIIKDNYVHLTDYPKLSEIDKQKIVIECYKSGMTQTDISVKYNISQYEVHRILKENGVEIHNRINDNLKTSIVEDYKSSGMSLASIARKNKINQRTVSKIIKENNIPIQKRKSQGKFNNNLKMLIIEDYNSGMSQKDVAEKYNCCQTTIFKILKENNVSTRDKCKKITDEQKLLIIEDYKSGSTLQSIANNYNCDQSYISRILKNNNVSTRTRGNKNMFTDEQKLLIIEDYNSGMSQKDVAEKYNCCQTRIFKILKENNVSTRTRGNKNMFTDEQKLLIIEDYKSGMSQTDVAKKYGISHITIFKILKENNVSTRTRGNKNMFTNEQKLLIIEDYNSGMSQKDVAEKYNCCQTTIFKILKENNVSTRDKYKKITDEQKLLIIEDYKLGINQCTIAEKYGISQSTIFKILIENNVSTKTRKNKLTDEQKLLIIEDYKSGMTQKDVAEKYGISQSIVSRILIENNVSTNKFTDEQKLLIIEDYKSGMLQKDIVEKYRISQSMVSRILKENKIEKNKITDSIKLLIIISYKSGMLQKDIAKKYGISQSMVSKILTANGIKKYNI